MVETSSVECKSSANLIRQSGIMGYPAKNALRYAADPYNGFLVWLPADETISLDISHFAWFRKSL
jgi:hypothetical protein